MKFSPTAFLLVIALLMSTVAAAGVDADDRFLAARDAVKVGDRAKLERIAPELKDHDLEAYVDYWRILLDLSSADPAVIKAFLARYERSYLAEKLRADWLKLLGMKNQWREFDAEYPALAQPDQELSCYALQSRMARGDASVLDDALPL